MRRWAADLRGSIVVFLVALPLCLGIALASDAPLAAGLIAGIIGGLVVGALGGSEVSVSGPAAGLAVIVASALAELGSYPAFAAAVVVAGLLQVAFAMLRAAALADYFPVAVIKGMLAAIGLLLIFKQIPHAIGFDADFMGDESFIQPDGHNTFSELYYAAGAVHVGATIVALISLVILIGWEPLTRKVKALAVVPAALVAVLVAVGLNALVFVAYPNLLIAGDHLVLLPFEGGVGSLVGALALPDFHALGELATWRVAVTIAVVASLESLLSLDAADKIDPFKRLSDKRRELIAQGLGNTASGLVGGLPVTAVIVRTSANVAGGSETRWAAVLHGVWLMLAVVALPAVLSLIPLAALAAVLLVVGYKLAKPALWKQMWALGWSQFVPFTVTVVAIVFTDLLVGIAVGMVVGVGFALRESLHQAVVMVADESHYLLRFAKDVSFMHKSEVRGILRGLPDGAHVRIDGSRSVFVDQDVVEVLADFVEGAPRRNIQVDIVRSPLALSPYFKEVVHG